MSALTAPAAGGAGFAAFAAQLIPRQVVKPSDVAVANSTTITADSALFLAVDANAVYEVTLHVLYTQGTVAQLVLGFTGPSGATFDWVCYGLATTVTASDTGSLSVQGRTLSDVKTIGGGATNCVARVEGRFTTSTTAGTLAFRWGPSAVSATGVTVRSTSFMTAKQIA